MKATVAVLLDGGFSAAGAVRLAGADIAGQLRCRDAHITGVDPDGDSLVASGIRVGGPLLLDGGFSAAGAVQLTNADIGGSLSLQGARLGVNKLRQALAGDGMKVSRDVLLDRAQDGSAFRAEGTVRLPSAGISGSLRCHGAQLTGRDQDGDTLVCNGLKIAGSIYLNDGFTTAGAVVLARADINGWLSCRGAALGPNDEQNALIGDGMKVSRDVLLIRSPGGPPFTATGAVRLSGADIGGQLSVSQAAALKGTDQDGDALLCNAVKVAGTVYLDGGLTTAGAVRFSRADIGGSLNCRGSRLGANKDQAALIGDRMKVSGGVLLDSGFAVDGSISFRGAQIAHELRWVPAAPPGGEVDLEGARAQQLADDWTGGRALGFWPEGRLRLAGFTYEGFAVGHPASVAQRLAWVRSQYTTPGSTNALAGGHGGPVTRQPSAAIRTGPASFSAQPYKQLAEAYRRAGQDSEARAVEVARRRDLRSYGNLPWHRKAVNWLLDVTIRYGFHTWRALAGLLALYLVVFCAALVAQHSGNLVVPATATPAQATALRCTSAYPCFYPAGYAVDLVIPLINVHQADFWRINGNHHAGWAWVGGTWIATGLGWFLATLLAVGYSGLARHD